jgi:hypothetical protein
MVGILKGVLIKTPVVPGTSTTVVGLTVDSTRLADAPQKKWALFAAVQNITVRIH